MRYRVPSVSIVFVLFLLFSSCSQQSTHQEHLKYYTTIGLQMKDVAPKVQTFFAQVKQGVLTAKQSESHALDKKSIDSLGKSLAENVEMLGNAMNVVDGLTENDNNLNFKQATVAYLIETRILLMNAMPKVLSLLENGLGKINDQQKDALKMFITKAQEVQVKSNELENLSLIYQKKYDITSSELKQYGL